MRRALAAALVVWLTALAFANPIRQIPNKIRKRIKATSPNPKVERTSPSAMPTQAPDMPTLPSLPEKPSRAERFFGAAAKVMTKSWKGNIFVWLPAISTDPNTGPTYGILPVLVLADPTSRHIRHLLAPSYTHNSLFGQTGTMRYYWYPTDDSQLFIIGSYSQNTNREIKVRYENPSAYDGVLFLRGEAYYRLKGSERFFGIGAGAEESAETGYVSRDMTARLGAGFNFLNSWRAAFGTRFRRLQTDTNIIPNTADLTARFPAIPGIGREFTVSNEFRLLWDSRDIPVTPSRGSSGELFVEKTSVALGSDSDYIRYGLEGKRFFPWKAHPKHLTVLHGLYEWANGPFIPFYELPSVGGRETLRGYGDGRFVDRGRLIFNLEHRYTFASVALMGIQTNFEVAPFFDIGTVFPALEQIRRKDFRPVWGGAFRAAVKPNVVGDVEVGVGKDGIAVFVDINYPF